MNIAEKLITIAENVGKVYQSGYNKGSAESTIPTITIENCAQSIKDVTAYLEENITPTVTGTTWFIRADGDTSLYYCQGFLYVSGVLTAILRATDTGGLYVALPSGTNGGAMWRPNTTFYRIDITQ